MSKVALRAYNRDIETLIDQGQLDEAIAHCQHVLKKYPKYLEIYRLLGKAYLEARQFDDSEDIFMRVLLAVPDDFVSHLGMSIVSDEQKDLDKAIWHMERAYEVAPSNVGVQGELRRLYGRRDGMEPPKIRLTRGALAQMYTKGGQYPQAIAEIQAVLAEDGNRSDLKVLLARAYFRAGMKAEAAEMCTELLKQYPYNLDANRILVEILPETNQAGSVDQYKRRVYALDPYAALVTGTLFDTDRAPDISVMIDRLEYESTSNQDTSWEPSPARNVFSTEPQVDAVEAVPDWMKQAGWEPASGEQQETASGFDAAEPAETAADMPEVASAEIPDWLKAMAPPAAAQDEPDRPAEIADQVTAEDLDWLAGLGAPLADGGTADQPQSVESDFAFPSAEEPEPEQTAPAGEAPGDDLDWIKIPETTAQEDETSAEPEVQSPVPSAKMEEPLPDWLLDETETFPQAPAAVQTVQDAAQEQPTEPGDDWLSGPSVQVAAEESPDLDWLNELGERQPDTPVVAADQKESPSAFEGEPAFESPDSESTGLSDWLGDVAAVGESPAQSAAISDWLKDLSEGEEDGQFLEETPGIESNQLEVDETSPVPEEAPKNPVVPDEELSSGRFDWNEPSQNLLDDLSALVSGPGTTETEQDDALSWLESLAMKQGANPEELITKPEERHEEIPDWVSLLGVEPVQAPPPAAVPEEEEPVVADALSGLVSGPGMTESEQDDALNWLESLAMKQGANPEELITKPEERHEEIPDWVSLLGEPVAETETPASSASQPADETEPSALTVAEEWLASLEKPAEDQSAALMPWEVEAPSETDHALPWETPLHLDERPTEPLSRIPPLDETPQELLSAEQPAEEKSDHLMPWEIPLAEDEAPLETQAGESQPAEDKELADWLASLSEPPAEETADLPGWLKDMSSDEQAPQPVQVSGWMPVQDIPEDAQTAPEEAVSETAVAPTEAVPQPEEISQAGSASAPEEAASETAVAPTESIPQPQEVSQVEPVPAPETLPESQFNFRPTTGLGEKDAELINHARATLLSGTLEEAMAEYGKIIKKGKLLEELIYDLKEVIDKLVEDTIVWQALGDAYMRANRLQEALDAYNKAEEQIKN